MKIAPGKWRVDTYVKRHNGQLRRVRVVGDGKTAAENAASDAAQEILDDTTASHSIDIDTPFGLVAERWLADFAAKVRRGDRAAGSERDYRDTYYNHLKPELGELPCHEVDNAGLLDEVIKQIRDTVGYSTAKKARTVLSNMCQYAQRHGAMTSNPMGAIERIERPRSEPIRVLAAGDTAPFLEAVRTWVGDQRSGETGRRGVRAQVWTDLPDMLELQLATGTRIGEVLALTGADVDIAERTVTFGHHLVRVPRDGIVRLEGRKGGEPGVTVRVPRWSLAMLRRRKLAAGADRPLFPTWNGQWCDPVNVSKRVSAACTGAGYPWVTSHVMRKTVASHLYNAGRSNEEISDQLGNTGEVVDGHYRARKVANEAIAADLESLMGDTHRDDGGDGGAPNDEGPVAL